MTEKSDAGAGLPQKAQVKQVCLMAAVFSFDVFTPRPPVPSPAQAALVLVALQAPVRPSEAVVSHVCVSIPSALKSLLHTSLERSMSLPADLFPNASYSQRRTFGIRPSFVRTTWPSQRKCLLF